MATNAGEIQYSEITRIAGQDELYAADVVVRPDGKKALSVDVITSVGTDPEYDVTDGFVPEPGNTVVGKQSPRLDVAGNLISRALVFTDEGSFRDDFSGNSLYVKTYTNCTLTNGSKIVTGIFDLKYFNSNTYMEIQGTLYEVDYIQDINTIYLKNNFAGSSGSNITCDVGYWEHVEPENGRSTIVVASSKATLTQKTLITDICYLFRHVDFCPMRFGTRLSLTQRIANQTFKFGVADSKAIDNVFAIVQFDGTNPNSLKFRTASSATDIQETVLNLSSSVFDSSNENTFYIPVFHNRACLLLNGVVVAIHEIHVPGNYDELGSVFRFDNSAGTSSDSSASIDFCFMDNVDRVDVANPYYADPLRVELMGATKAGTLVQIAVNDEGCLIVAPHSDINSTVVFGDVGTAAQTEAALMRTAYTEKTSASQISIASSSANDTSAGTGARTVKITYYDTNVLGPYTETITLNGTGYVNSAATNIKYIQSIEVVTAGSGGKNAGTLTLKAAAAGGGATVGTIAVGDNQTFWCHRYVGRDVKSQVTGVHFSNNSTVVGGGGVFYLKATPLAQANAINKQVTPTMRLFGQDSTRSINFKSPQSVSGPALIKGYVVPETSSSVTYRMAFEFYEVSEPK